jgi:GNAT superfamily N-acetyltransferase
MKQISTLNPYVSQLLKFTPLQYIVNTFYENPKLGKLFVDDEETPNSCILSLKHLLFLGGNLSQDCSNFLFNELLTHDIRNSLKVFYIIYPNEIWKNAFMELFSNNCNQYERSLYRSKLEGIDIIPNRDEVLEITPELMTSGVSNLIMIIEEVISTNTYDSMEDYLMRGIGYTLIINNKACGFCTSEYPSKESIAIGIEVLKEHQQKGYAKIMARAFLNKAIQRGLTTYWDCWRNNIASVNTALTCKFEKVADYPILLLKF